MGNTAKTQEISRKDVLRLLLDIMPDGEAEVLLKTFTYDQIHQLFIDEESRKNIIGQANNSIIAYELLANAVKRMPSLVENKDNLLRDYAIEHYNELSRESRREFCIEMMNQRDFQHDLCDKIFDEMEKQIPSVKPFMDALNVKENFMALYDNGGYHDYSEE